jgi:Cd2+/Zn2+-exporting ATPase
MVYETLRRLHTRGAVLETVEGRATLYRPLAPQTLLDRHEQDRKRLVLSLRESLAEIYHAAEGERMWTFSGGQAACAYARRMLNEAEKEAYLVLSDEALDVLEPELVEAAARGVALNTLLTGEREFQHGQVARHPPLESELQELNDTLLVVTDRREALIANLDTSAVATATSNRNLVLIARQFIWMELFAQRVYASLGADLLARLDPDDRRIFTHHTATEGATP